MHGCVNGEVEPTFVFISLFLCFSSYLSDLQRTTFSAIRTLHRPKRCSDGAQSPVDFGFNVVGALVLSVTDMNYITCTPSSAVSLFHDICANRTGVRSSPGPRSCPCPSCPDTTMSECTFSSRPMCTAMLSCATAATPSAANPPVSLGQRLVHQVALVRLHYYHAA